MDKQDLMDGLKVFLWIAAFLFVGENWEQYQMAIPLMVLGAMATGHNIRKKNMYWEQYLEDLEEGRPGGEGVK